MKTQILLFYIFFTRQLSQKLILETYTKNIPLDSSKDKEGQDVWYSSKKLIVIADGANEGEYQTNNPREYPESLVENVKNLVSVDFKKYIKNPKSLLINAVNQTPKKGMSTLLIMTVDRNDMLWSAKVGDSGFVVYKRKYDSDSETYRYAPILLSQPHEKQFNDSYLVGDNGFNPSESLTEHTMIKPGYIIVTYSKTVMNNLYQYQMDTIINNNCEDGNIDTQKLAEQIAKKTYEISKSKQGSTPFSQGAIMNGNQYEGGVEGEITVMVSQVKEEI